MKPQLARARTRRVPRRTVVLLALVTGGLAVVLLVASGSRLCLSRSAPPGLYVPSDLPLERGAWIRLCLPGHIAAFGYRRGYHPAGWPPARCPDGSAEVLKRLAALPGDLVEVSEDAVLVNRTPLANSRPLPADSAGRPLPQLAGLRLRLAPGQCWVYSDTVANSWDSRYYGPLPLTAIRHRMRPLVTF